MLTGTIFIPIFLLLKNVLYCIGVKHVEAVRSDYIAVVLLYPPRYLYIAVVLL